jgi:glycosyltransferase involved in cell wall biosynthesis
MVEDGVTGLLVEPRDSSALAAALSELIQGPERATKMGEAGRERQQREFSLEAMARRVGDLYEELYASKRGSGGG